MFRERLEVCIKHFWKTQLSRFWKNILWNSQQVCAYEKVVGKGKSAPYMTKALRKEIMRRSKIETKYFNLKTNNTLKVYKKLTWKITAAGYARKKGNFFLKFKSVICYWR